jgi:hypothetical protein
VNEALGAWDTHPDSHKPEIARTTFLKSKILKMLGEVKEAERCRQDAILRRKQIAGAPSRPDDDLTEEDFDTLVMFWSR